MRLLPSVPDALRARREGLDGTHAFSDCDSRRPCESGAKGAPAACAAIYLPKRAGVPPANYVERPALAEVYACRKASSSGRVVDEQPSGCQSANDGPLLQTFGTHSRGNVKAVADQEHCCAYVSGQGPHLQRQTLVTKADRTVRPKEKSESIFDGLHCALQVEEGDLRLRHRVSTHAARVNPWGLSGWRRHCNTRPYS